MSGEIFLAKAVARGDYSDGTDVTGADVPAKGLPTVPRWRKRDLARIVGPRMLKRRCRACGNEFSFFMRGAGRPREFCHAPCTRARSAKEMSR